MSWQGVVMKYLCFLFLLLSSCAVVKPWEREDLADPLLNMNENPIEKGLKQHHLDFREGTTGGEGTQSGGCGCG